MLASPSDELRPDSLELSRFLPSFLGKMTFFDKTELRILNIVLLVLWTSTFSGRGLDELDGDLKINRSVNSHLSSGFFLSIVAYLCFDFLFRSDNWGKCVQRTATTAGPFFFSVSLSFFLFLSF